jgi:hypothetical protein
MPSADRLRKDWEARVGAASTEPAPRITEAGLVLGAGTVLVQHITDRHGRSTFAIDGNEERILALLAVAYGRPVEPETISHIRRASEQYARGEITLALIHLARAGLPRLSDPKNAAYRLFVGEALLDDGLSPRDLLKASGIDPSFLNRVGKGFNVAEPRVPAGNGIESGEWTNDYGSGVTPIATRQTPDEYQRGDPDQFFDAVYGPVHALARRLGIDEIWLLGLAAHESNYLCLHDRVINNPFGVTRGGGPNVHYASIADAVAYWERRYGPMVRGATSAQDFVQRLFNNKYNTSATWPSLVLAVIGSIPQHLSPWKAKREI